MIVDFQHHFVPRELAKEPRRHQDRRPFRQGRRAEHDAELGAVRSRRAYRDDGRGRHRRSLPDRAAGMCVDTETVALRQRQDPRGGEGLSRPLHRRRARQSARRAGRAARARALRGRARLSRRRHHLRDRRRLSSTRPTLEPFWREVCRLGLFVFIHPALKLNYTQPLNGYDMARSVGREFSLIAATVRLINSGLLDRHPNLRIHMSHLGGGIATMLGRIRKFQDRELCGAAGHPVHGKLPARDFDHYCASGWCSTPPACAARSSRCRRRCSNCRPGAASSAPTIRRKSATPRASRSSSPKSARSAPTAANPRRQHRPALAAWRTHASQLVASPP